MTAPHSMIASIDCQSNRRQTLPKWPNSHSAILLPSMRCSLTPTNYHAPLTELITTMCPIWIYLCSLTTYIHPSTKKEKREKSFISNAYEVKSLSNKTKILRNVIWMLRANIINECGLCELCGQFYSCESHDVINQQCQKMCSFLLNWCHRFDCKMPFHLHIEKFYEESRTLFVRSFRKRSLSLVCIASHQFNKSVSCFNWIYIFFSFPNRSIDVTYAYYSQHVEVLHSETCSAQIPSIRNALKSLELRKGDDKRKSLCSKAECERKKTEWKKNCR